MFLTRDEKRAEELRASGIKVEGVRGPFKVPASATADAAGAGTFQLVIVCVKAYETATAMAQHAAAVGPTTIVTTFQNGLGNLQALASVVGDGRVLGGTTALGANLWARSCTTRATGTRSGEPTGGFRARPSTWRDSFMVGMETRAVATSRASGPRSPSTADQRPHRRPPRATAFCHIPGRSC